MSGACFLARRRALDELGGFDESYFMYAEDTDLCWRARRAGGGSPTCRARRSPICRASPRRRRPYRMLVAHHRSVFRFASRTERGWRRLALPAMAVLLGLRLASMCARQALDALAWRRRAGPSRVSCPTMARGDAGKWVARAGATGGGRSYRGQRPMKWYGSLAMICLLGVALIVYSRYERQHPAAATQPAIGAHWYQALGFDVCGTFEANLAANPNASTAPDPGDPHRR